MNTSLKKYIAPSVIAVVLLSNLVLGFSRLGSYSSVDEPYWTYGRISKFWNSVAAHKWKSTSVNDKPGITVAILSGVGLLKIDPLPYKNLRDDPKTDNQLNDINTINFFFRLPIFLFCTLLLPLFYFLLKKLLDETTALIAFIFIGLSPLLLGISLIINPDSLLWIFLPLSVLSYFVFQKSSEKKYLYASSVLLGLSLLTKYVSNILYIFFFFLPFLEYIFSKKKPEIKTYLKKSALDYLVIAAISMITFFILYPATWVNFDILLKGTFLSKAFETTWPLFVGMIALIAADTFLFKNRVSLFVLDFFFKHKKLLIRVTFALFLALLVSVLANTYTGMKIFDTKGTLASPKGTGSGSLLFVYANALSADLYSLIFGISPIAFFSFVAALLLAFKKKWIDSYEAKIVFYLVLFILFYYFASTVNHVVATVRYQITLYPLAFIIAAIGLARIFSLEKIKRFAPSCIVLLLVIGVSLASLLAVKPFYFAYNSALLPQKYFVNLKDMGDGSWEAATFLNALPNAKALTVWSDKGAVCAVFKGNCKIGFTQKDLRTANLFDYVVVSSGRKSRSLKLSHPGSDPIDFKKAYQTEETAATITIGGRPNNFVKVIPAQNLIPITPQ